MKKWKEELNASIVGATSSRPHFEGMTKNKGITLIALIITIIVMLILVGVTINVALNGGIFGKGEEASSKTKIAQIKEALEIKKAEVLADNNGKEPSDYGIKLKDLNISENIKKEYESKLKISADGSLYYDASVVTNEAEQNQFEELGIQKYTETNTTQLYSFTLNEINTAIESKGAYKHWNVDGAITYEADVFWEVIGAEEDLRGKYGVSSDGNIIGEMSTNSEILKSYGEEQTEDNYVFIFMEHHDLDKDLITISFGQIKDGNLREPDFTTGGETLMLSELGDIVIYFGVK